MANRLTKLATIISIPAVPAIAGRAAYCYTEQRVVETVYGAPNKGSSKGSSNSGSSAVKVTQSSDPNAFLTGGYSLNLPTASGGGSANVAGFKGKNKVVTVKTCLPAVAGRPGTPASQSVDTHAGWNAGGRSIEGLDGNVSFRFALPKSPTGIICGISDGAPIRSYSHVGFGFLVRQNEVSIIESGAIVAVLTGITLSSQPAFEVRRVNSVVSYFVDDTLKYESAGRSAGVVYAEATLYSAGDYVDSPVFSVYSYAEAGGYLPRFIGTISDSDDTIAGGLLPRMTLNISAGPTVTAGGRLPSFRVMASDYDYSEAGGRLPRLEMVAEVDSTVIDSSLGGGRVPPPVGSSLLLVGTLASVDAVCPSMACMIADYDYSEAGGVWPRSGYSSGVWENFDAPDEIDDGDLLLVGDACLIDAPFLIVAMDGLEVGGSAELILLADIEAMDFLGLSSQDSISGVIELLASSGLVVNDDVNSRSRTAIQYAVNAMTGAITTYEGYGFTHFTWCDGQAYGCRPDGLYRLEGDTDDGKVINAVIDLGQRDFGSNHLKRLDAAYIGVTTDGDVVLRMTGDDGEPREYRVCGGESVRRARLAKGLSARFWSMQLEITSATRASIDSVELMVGVSQRKSMGRRL